MPHLFVRYRAVEIVDSNAGLRLFFTMAIEAILAKQRPDVFLERFLKFPFLKQQEDAIPSNMHVWTRFISSRSLKILWAQ